MGKERRGSERREDALSRERIVEAAIALLDDQGEDGLTFRALATRLETGAGAIYWHIANKDELLVAAADVVVARAMPEVPASATPQESLRGLAVAVFETVDAHPWVGAQLSLAPWESPMLRIFERIGHQLQAMGLSDRAQFTAGSTLMSYIVGVSIQNAANGRMLDPSVDRVEFLNTVSARWKELDANEYPFTRKLAAQLPGHDDLAEFLAGIDLILTGIAASR
ncbi:TetR/AcrR family transcriptional regulator [Corallococcus sp. AB004]|nr:TetR/AcrR family transcriptional regulator [Corallococcus sp. AB004]